MLIHKGKGTPFKFKCTTKLLTRRISISALSNYLEVDTGKRLIQITPTLPHLRSPALPSPWMTLWRGKFHDPLPNSLRDAYNFAWGWWGCQRGWGATLKTLPRAEGTEKCDTSGVAILCLKFRERCVNRTSSIRTENLKSPVTEPMTAQFADLL
jgi:hypothetical protein